LALTVAQSWAHAIAHFKLPSAAFSSEEVRSANVVQSIIGDFHPWHWTLTAGTDITVVGSTQDYTMATADQNKVADIANANLASGAQQLNELTIQTWPLLRRETTTGRPIAAGLISPTQIRLWPNPDVGYTLQWRYYARPIVFTANTESYTCPDSFSHVILQGAVWKLSLLLDDERQQVLKDAFYKELSELRAAEFRLNRRSRA
jgi:hypothetical protein